jgi:hypothetical protein
MRSLQPCPECHDGIMGVVSTRSHRSGTSRTRYLKCTKCGKTGKEHIPGAARKRPRRDGVYKLEHTKALSHDSVLDTGAHGDRIQIAMTGTPMTVGIGNHDLGGVQMFSIFQLATKLDVDWHIAKDWAELGNVPRPVRVGEYVRWRVVDVEQWLSAGCPTLPEMGDDEDLEFLGALVAEIDARNERNLSNE